MLSPNQNAKARWQPGSSSSTEKYESEFCFPRLGTVKAFVLADLLSSRHLTHEDTWLRHGSSRLAHHIWILRGLGWDIHAEMIDASTTDGRNARIAEYSLPGMVIRQAGEAGRRFVERCRRSA